MIVTKLKMLALALAILMPLGPVSWAQGPRVSYFFHPATELGWARCEIVLGGGSRQKIPFLPVVSTAFERAPLGTDNYRRDIQVAAPLVFIGDGIANAGVRNCYRGRRTDHTIGEIDVAGKAVFFCYDFPQAGEAPADKAVPLAKRISEAAARKAAAVVLFSALAEHPFPSVAYENEAMIPRLPAIIITRASAAAILESAGLDADAYFKNWKETGIPPESSELISLVRLRIQGAFAKAETKNFLFRYRPEELSKATVEAIARVNERSLTFLIDLLKSDPQLRWNKLLTVYFSGYDSKIFYTHHWGTGLASDEGAFMVHRGGVPDLGLAVHENAHIFTGLNWGDSTSFMEEGVGKYAEAMATLSFRNDLETLGFLKENQLFPLEDMLGFQIGIAGQKTSVGYPAAGSFVGFLVRTYGLPSLKNAFRLEGRPPEEKARQDTWQTAYGKTLRDLEKEWLTSLAQTHNVDRKYVDAHLEKAAQAKKAVEVGAEVLEAYVGEYEFPQAGRVSVVRQDGRLFLHAGPMGKTEVVPESETQFRVKAFDARLTFIRDEKGQVNEIILLVAGGEMRGRRIARPAEVDAKITFPESRTRDAK